MATTRRLSPRALAVLAIAFVVAVATILPARENLSLTPFAGAVQGTPTRQTGIVGPRFT